MVSHVHAVVSAEDDKRIPKNGVSFVDELIYQGHLMYKEDAKIAEEIKKLGEAIKAMEEEERLNTPNLTRHPARFRDIIDNLTRWEEYDASKYLCYAFRKKDDERKDDDWVPFGNMNSGFEFDVQGVHFHNSESAYICGMFSDNIPEQQAIQQQLVEHTNGKTAKGNIRYHNEDKARKDWYDFNVPWMIYVVWQKVCGNKEFRDLLLSVPDEAIIIEDTTFQKVRKPNDTPVFWGARNQERGEYFKMVKKYTELTKLSPVKAERNRYILQSFNNFTDYGVFKGCNVMGKILTLCRMCWKLRIEPPIDYELLRAKSIYLLGHLLTFTKG